ncbi:hypothetical protein Golob_027298 [Gossypium lobatum]|uniref:DUF4283 domain-containing protein n=1 Tax=Gossypium lobatum TaxID=34289 RepID=A0A7J8NH65_9ROSI|nr:hypothetical protein [Gossypium lobatum]
METELDRLRISDGMDEEAMRKALANLWHPLGGIEISNLGGKRFFILLREMEDPMLVPLLFTHFWEYDWQQLSRGNQLFMHIRELLGVRSPLRRRKKSSFCPIQLRVDENLLELGWDISLRAPLALHAALTKNVWLRNNCIETGGSNALNSINRVLGVNLDEKLMVGFGQEESTPLGLVSDPMLHDLENDPIGEMDGKKMTKNECFSERFSEILDFEEKRRERLQAYQAILLVTTKRQVDRQQ